jgi:nanoRNase/pAp phosphatase (c-di-AMP/oligoRNAs hydrolase)
MSTDPALAMFRSQAKLEELLELLKDSESLLILTHDNPDPDAISAASCLRYIISKRLPTKVRVGYGGMVGRAENRRMLKFLKIHTSRLSEARIRKYKSILLIDTQPHTGNNSLPRRMQVKGVIDHHPERKSTRATFLDIRPDYGAAATILAEYLFASGLDIPANLATALFYGIASETQDLGREVSDADTAAYLRLFPKANKRLLSKIRRPVVKREHFAYMARAITNAVTYKHTIASCLGRVENPDVVAQVAEMLLTLERMTWSLATGRYKGNVLVSVRTTNVNGRAGTVARRIVGSGGTAGGHDMVGGGQVDCEDKPEKQRDEMEHRIVETFFRVRGKPETGELTPLMAPEKEERRADEEAKASTQQDGNLNKREEVTR